MLSIGRPEHIHFILKPCNFDHYLPISLPTLSWAPGYHSSKDASVNRWFWSNGSFLLRMSLGSNQLPNGRFFFWTASLFSTVDSKLQQGFFGAEIEHKHQEWNSYTCPDHLQTTRKCKTGPETGETAPRTFIQVKVNQPLCI